MASLTRKRKLESVLHREIATCLLRDLRDPRLGLVTITRVEMTNDLQQAKAFYTVLGTEAQARSTAHALDSAAPYVRRAFAPAVHTRLLPTLAFVYDDQERKRLVMDEKIRRARATDPDQGAQPTPPADASES